jgi:hypothetical protein
MNFYEEKSVIVSYYGAIRIIVNYDQFWLIMTNFQELEENLIISF